MTAFPSRVTLGRSGLQVSKLGLGSSFGAPASSYLEAFERGVNYFYWGSIRRGAMATAIRDIAKRDRDGLVVVLQSYSRSAALMKGSCEIALRRLRLDCAEVLLLGWHNKLPSPRILDMARTLKEQGKVKHIALSTHRRSLLPELVDDALFDIWHVRYNACHRGAEREVFPVLEGRSESERPGMVTYTTTRWGHLCDPKKTPEGERTPTGTDCYRFALTDPRVDLCLAGPDDPDQMQQALRALELGPLDAEQADWMRRVGDAIYRGDATSRVRDGAGAAASA